MSDKLNHYISKNFINHENYDDIIYLFNQAIKVGVDFKLQDKVINYKNQGELKKEISNQQPIDGMKLEETLDEFKKVIMQNSTNFGSKGFMAFPDAANSIAGLTGAILMNFLNQNLINSTHCSPAASIVETNVITWLRELIGYKINKDIKSVYDVGGVILSGGVLSNTMAMLLARENKFNNTLSNGITFDINKCKVIIPEYIDHYSIKSSLGWLGLGDKNILTVKTKDFKIDLDDLDLVLKENKGNIMAIVAYAGDSRSMTIDNFEEVHKRAKENNIWFHIDACHGMQYAFSKKLRHKLGKIELSDSITIDPHKVLFLPYNLSALLVKNPEKLSLISGKSDLITKEDTAFGQVTPFLGSKAFWSLKLWFVWKTLGTENIGKIIEQRHNMSCYLAELVKNDECLELLNKEVNINSVIFMYIPKYLRNKSLTECDIREINTFNASIQQKMFEKGDYYLHTFPIPDISRVLSDKQEMLTPLRFMSGNACISEQDIETMLKEVKQIAETI